MTELEALAEQANYPIFVSSQMLIYLKRAYALGRASLRTPAQVEAWERNRMKGGKPGRKDRKPRVRRTRAEIEARKQQEMK